MKKTPILATTMAVLALTRLASADVTIHITGSSAFRAATSNAILNVMTGETYAYNGSSYTGATYQIIKGTVPGVSGIVTVKTQWSGSVAGIRDVAAGNLIGFLPDSTPTSPTGTSGASTTTLSNEAAEIALADNLQGSTTFRSPVLNNASPKVGIIPFAFVAGKDIPSGITNITTQLAKGLLQNGTLPTTQFVGGTDSTLIYAVGRDNLSGTRLVTLAETGFGTRNPVVQYLPTLNTTGSTNTVASIAPTGNDGNDGAGSGGTVAAYLRYGTQSVSDPNLGTTGPIGLIGYVGEADSYNAVFGLGGITGNGAGNAHYLSYNGVAGFGGTAKRPTGASTTSGSPVVTLGTGAASDATGLLAGQIVTGSGIQPGSVITSVNAGANQITLDSPATASGDPTSGGVTFQIGALLPAQVQQGIYSFWNYEYLLFRTSVVTGDKLVFANALKARIKNFDYGFSGLADDTKMKVSRDGDGLPPLPNGN